MPSQNRKLHGWDYSTVKLYFYFSFAEYLKYRTFTEDEMELLIIFYSYSLPFFSDLFIAFNTLDHFV